MVKKHKILYLMAGDPEIYGGGKRGFLQIMTHLDKSKFDFYACCALNSEQEKTLQEMNGKIVKNDIQNENIWFALQKLVRFLKREDIDIIHSQGPRADVFARIAPMLIGRKVKIINTAQMLVDGYDVNRIRKTVYCTIDRLTERVADKFIVVSNSLKEQLIKKHFISEAKISKIYNGIELAEYSTQVPDVETKKIRKKLNIDDSTKVIGAIGRMVWQKGFEYLIEAIPKILEPIPDVKFMIVGDGPLNIPLETMSRKLKVTDSVIFAGFRSDIREILAAIDILVIPSLLEGFPMVTLEAMAMAKPIIATRIDGVIEQITDGENGILVPPKDHEALTESILRLIHDKELSERLGRLARKKVEQEFSVEKMVAETEKIYLSLLSTN